MSVANNDVNLDIDWVDEFSGDPQTSKIFNTHTHLEDGVKQILKLSETSQEKLINMLDEIKTQFTNSIILYNPGVKSYESALRKAQNETGIPNHILRLNDGYRASIISNDYSNIPSILSEIDKLLPKYRFEKMSVLNTFANPWPNGYRDYNCRLKDLENEDLVGELQIHFCPIKLFSQTVGHLSYEILRTLKKEDICTQKIKDALEKIANAGYTSALELKDNSCFEKIAELQKKHDGEKTIGGRGLSFKKYKGRKRNKFTKKRRSRIHIR